MQLISFFLQILKYSSSCFGLNGLAEEKYFPNPFERIIISFQRIINPFELIINSFERIIISCERILICLNGLAEEKFFLLDKKKKKKKKAQFCFEVWLFFNK